jgi:aerobic-type carbon monoxide dehydrogenase small subunit (CoxS/CutS family)
MPQKLMPIVTGQARAVEVEGATPLLYVLRNDIGLNTAKFGCSVVQCGACSVIAGGQAARSCQLPVALVRDAAVVTIEGPGTQADRHPPQPASSTSGRRNAAIGSTG